MTRSSLSHNWLGKIGAHWQKSNLGSLKIDAIESRVRIVGIKAVLVDANAISIGGKVTFIVAMMT